MIPTQFPESNCRFCAPEDLAESQCGTIHAYLGKIERGSVEGSPVIVTAWLPTPEELAALNAGKPIFISFLTGQLPPHFTCMEFNQAINPA
jgi:hypothetical protein